MQVENYGFKYKTVILDVDGVIFDSNQLKENNIHQSCLEFTDRSVADEFTQYFTKLNGVPREKKIHDFFGKNYTLGENILEKYNYLNSLSVYNVPFTEGAEEMIRYFNKHATLIALSGGAQNELEQLFSIRGISTFFSCICGGPKQKSEYMIELSLEQPILYVGDSKLDYEVASAFGCDFIFLSQYSQMENPKGFFNTHSILGYFDNPHQLITSFTSILKQPL
jgi:phosphoglycolate phosphatase-like HAD superfamily hydrolase